MNEYIAFLYRQYCQGIGKKFDINNFFDDYDAFSYWMNEVELNINLYLNYLAYLGVDVSSYGLFEANKGCYDSVIGTGAKMISPFASTLGGNDSKIITRGKDILLTDENSSVTPDDIGLTTIITQNPYDISFLRGFKEIHDSGKDICIGVFGENDDKDKKSKLSLIKFLGENIDDTESFYDTSNGKYLSVIKSKRKVKINKKILTK